MSYLNKNIQNRRRVQKNIYGELDLDITGDTGPQGPIGPIGPPGPGSTPAEPFSEGIVFGKTLNGTVSLGENGNFNNFPNNVTIGNNSANSVLGYSNNSIVGNNILQNYTQSNVTNNAIIGNNLYNNTTTINNVSDNIVIGSDITANTGSDVVNNILMGRNIISNCEDSIIINTGNTGYNSNFNNTFYLGNGINQPTEDNNLFVDNNYDKYIIKDIPSPLTNVYYFNYSITAKNNDGSNTLDPQTSNGPFPVDTFPTYSDLNQGPGIFPEVQFSTLIDSAKLLTDYAYITPFGNPNLISFPAGNWNIKAYISTSLSGAAQVTPRFYKYNNSVETFLFNGNTVPIVGSGIQTVNIPTSQASFIVNKDDRLVVKIFAEPSGGGPFATLTLYLEGESPWTLSTPFVETPYLTNFLVHYDAVSGNVTKQMINNVSDAPSSVKVLKRAPEGTLFRNFTGNNGIIVNQLTDDIDISFNTGLLPIDMEPTVSGLAYGKQDQGILFTGLGRELVPKDRSISIFNQAGSGDIQNYNGTDNILINNNDNQNTNTNALMSNIITNTCVTKDTSFDHSTVLASELDVAAISTEFCTIIGNYKGQLVNEAREAMYICNNAGPGNLTLKGRQSLYLGNATFPETVNDREAYISGYDRFFLRSPQNASNIYQLYFDPTTSEVTWFDVPAAYNLPIKLPTTLGGSYGLNFAASGSEMTGRNSFNNYTSGVNVSGITSVGNNHFTLNTSTTFSDSMIFGSTVRFNSLLNMTNSLIASNILNNTGVTSIQNNAIIMPKTSSLAIAGGVTSLTGANFLTSSDISLTTDPNYSIVIGSGSTINPGANNIAMVSGGSNSLVTMQGIGNMLFLNTGTSAISLTTPVFNNCVIFNSGSLGAPPTASSQFCISNTTLRTPNILQIGTNQNSNNIRLMGFDTSTGLISPYLTNTFSRVYRQQANTNAAGSVTFNTGLTVSNIAGTTYHAQVVNASLTVAYTCQTTSVTASTVTIQVFQSTNVILGGPSMVPAPANIVVSFSMNY